MAEILLLIGVGILFLLLLLTVVALLLYSGLFENIEIGSGKPPIGETIIAYKYARGPYRGAGYLFSEVARVGPSIKKSLGIYYDDAQMVDEYKCRYIVGAILAEGDEQVDEEIKKNFEDEDVTVTPTPPPAQNESTQPVTPTPPSQNESTLPGPSNLQDNVHSSEQVTPDQKKAEDEHETGSEGTAESGSSFEEIGVDKENIPSIKIKLFGLCLHLTLVYLFILYKSSKKD
ncbi:hypothetical protein KUTeg_021196 [Tegillarca granosa]|uniref:Testis-expressed sequence 264 protein n=1 Tax=Tegillarca granosa TaxID=220873 RepID=A0ABQ9EA33_TEGGR|nr:hypothetical protein KUTeg_021196 [Tegillarca granosa]